MFLSAPYKKRAETYDLARIDDVEVKSLILDRKGREVGRFFVENRDKVSIDEIPDMMINALVAGEDQRFFKHDGVDRQGVLRAAYLNFKAGRNTQGASTITQQLARNAFYLKEESLKRREGGLARKAVEAFLAIRIEKEYSKRQILEFYLNRVAFGSGYYGVRSAALGYFGKEPRDLTVSECCSLVGCIKNPTRISPLNSLEENKKARNQVLRRLIDEKMIEETVGEQLKLEPVVINPKPIRRGTSHLYERIGDAVRKHLGKDAFSEGGYTIHTSIDLDVQRAMEQSLLRQLASVEAKDGYEHSLYETYRREDGPPKYIQGAGLMLDNTNGSVIAYVGGRDFTHSQYDFVRSGSKSIGTAFLPIVYTTALEQGRSLISPLEDRPLDNRLVMVDGREGILGEWGMETYDPEYEGDISLRRGLEVSKIGASVRLGKELGLSNVTETAGKLGIDMTDTKLFPRLLVGTSDVSMEQLVKAYSVFPNEGELLESSYFIDRIVDSQGELRYSVKSTQEKKQVISAENAYLMHSMLQGALSYSSGGSDLDQVHLDKSLAGKTGTTYDFADNWFVGYNGGVTCAMWMGFLDGSSSPIYQGAFSKDTLLPSWLTVMSAVNKNLPVKGITPPEALVTAEVCRDSRARKTRYCQDFVRNELTGVESYESTTYSEYFVKGIEPIGYCDFHSVIEGQLTENLNFGARGQKLARSHSIPVQPKEPLLIGRDPYGSEQPDFVPKDQTSNRGSQYELSFDELDNEDIEAKITLDRPARISIYEE
ncbi:MAG: transglycosylase domain-containing protein [Akkermansiaceae bacterium]